MEPTSRQIPDDVLRAFRRGDRGAFETIMRAYDPLVRATAARFWTGAFHREEAIQEVWAQAWRKRETLDESRLDRFGGWLAVLARRRCIDLLRAQGRATEPSADAELDTLAGPPTPDPIEQHQLAAALDAFQADLDEDWRAFFQLHFVEGQGYPEICERLSINPARCKYLKKVLLARAREDRALRAALGREERDRREEGDHGPS